MNLPKLALTIVSAATSIGSVIGTHEYILHETSDHARAVIASACLGIAIFVCLDIACNRKPKIAHRISILALAVILTMISIWTVYQTSMQPIIAAHTAKLTQQHQQALLTIKNNSARKAQALDDQRQAYLNELSELQKQSITDRSSKQQAEAQLRKRIHPNRNGATIKRLAKAEQQRNTRRKELNAELGKISQKLQQPATAQPELIITPVPMDYAIMARASLYDALTWLFIYIGSFYCTRKKTKRTPFVHWSPFARAKAPLVHHHTTEKTPNTIGLADIQGALELRKISANAEGHITVAIIQQVTGKGRRIAQDLLKDAASAGLLQPIKKGKGITYCYPHSKQTAATSENVISIRPRKAAGSQA